MAVAATQEHFRVRTDATAAQGGTPVWSAAIDTNPTSWSIASLTPFRIRISVEETGTSASGTSAWNIFVSRNGGAYAQVTTSTTYVIAADATAGASANNSAITTSLLTATGTFDGVGVYNDTGTTSTLSSIPASDYVEFEFGLQFTSSALLGDTYAFRVYKAGATITNYTNTPTITITVNSISASLVPVSNVTVNEHQILIAAAALAPAASLGANLFDTSLGIPPNLTSASPQEDAIPALFHFWADSALFVPVLAGTFTSTLFEIAAATLSPSATLGSVANQWMVAASTLSPTATLSPPNAAQLDVSTIALTPVSTFGSSSTQWMAALEGLQPSPSMIVDEAVREIAAAVLSSSAILGASAQDYIFDLAESLSPVTTFVSASNQWMTAAVNFSGSDVFASSSTQWMQIQTGLVPSASLLPQEAQFDIAASSLQPVTTLSASALKFILDSSESLTASLVSTVKETMLLAAPPVVAITSSFASSSIQKMVAATIASGSAIFGSSSTQIETAAATLSPVDVLAVSAAQLLVSTIKLQPVALLGAAAQTGIFDSSESLLPSTVLLVHETMRMVAASTYVASESLVVTEVQRLVTASALTSSIVLSPVNASQLMPALSTLSPVSTFGISARNFIFDLIESFQASSVSSIHETMLLTSSSQFAGSLSLGINAIEVFALSDTNLASAAANLGQPLFSLLGEMIPVSIATGDDHIGQPVFELLFPLLANSLASKPIFIDRPPFIAGNKNSLYPTLRRLEGLSIQAEARAQSRLLPSPPPFTPSQIKKMKAFTDNYMQRLSRE